MLKQLPNTLTILRILLAPAVAYAIWRYWEVYVAGPGPASGRALWATLSASLFAAAAFTDLLDGQLARLLRAESRLGRILDPIADKLLVGLPLIVLSVAAFRLGAAIWPIVAGASAAIIVRDVAVTIVRLTAPDGEGAPVSRLAKWKTALELIVVATPLCLVAVNEYAAGDTRAADINLAIPLVVTWLCLLVCAAALSLWTGAQYLFRKRSAANGL